ncbi:hypothetical protein PR202_gb22759 [Eleusine coracana subsp. coracana]|uniref:Protein kinase domain-containing protein n=1 Tax=Eleusine coracana subsp. coracana TaxID=191504 RepID=A0AAV5FHH7_ELECO|nr:hypothetical protein PR202_gb22759 [Eleusine coracana subsp. coracana]
MAKQALAALVTITLLLACFPREARCEESSDVRASLVAFLVELAGGDPQLARDLRWDATVQPCDPTAPWTGVTCSGNNDGRVRTIVLENQGPGKLTGTLNATLLCAASTLRVLSLQGNAVRGGLEDGVAACRALTHLYLAGNRLSGALPPALARLRDLHVVDVAGNGFSGAIPVGLAGIGLKTFLANDNTFSGAVPDFDLRGFEKFSVANNSLTGPIPKNVGKFGDARFFLPNAAGICGQPVLPACQQSSFPSPSPGTDSDFGAAPPPSTGSNSTGDKGRSKRTKVLMYVGYALLGAVILALVTYLCVKKRRSKLQRKFKQGGGRRVTDSSRVTTATTSVISASKSVYSIPTSVVQSPAAAATGLAAASAPSPSLVVLRRSGTAASITSAAAAAAAKELRFEDLLKSPAELLGRGRFGSSYKVVVPGGAELAVKRVKDGAVGEGEFRRRMERVGRARHAAVLPPLAFYCAMQEKLVVYEFQTNGSLERLLHGKQSSPCSATFSHPWSLLCVFILHACKS